MGRFLVSDNSTNPTGITYIPHLFRSNILHSTRFSKRPNRLIGSTRYAKLDILTTSTRSNITFTFALTRGAAAVRPLCVALTAPVSFLAYCERSTKLAQQRPNRMPLRYDVDYCR